MTETAQQQAYKVLARQYRPKHFHDVVGQESAVSAITYALKNQKLAHAYMFSGTRGVGKTTLARLLARAVNCLAFDAFVEKGDSPFPCGVCENCKAIENDGFIDVLEMDAASHTGVDDMRAIIDTVRYKPTVGRYKVYIIDEVHMLSKSAFNALLKTLEEPPENTLFLFATTELKRVPITILSRCQRFEIRNISVEEVANHLKNVAAQEAITIDEDALLLIARAASGSMRDALSLLDRVRLLAEEGTIDATMLKDMLGFADESQMDGFIEIVCKGDLKGLADKIDTFYKAGIEPLSLLHDVMERIYHLTLKGLSDDQADAPYTMGQLMRLWQMLSMGIPEIQRALSPTIALKMLMMRVAYTHKLPTPDAILARLDEGRASSKIGASVQTFEGVGKLFEQKREMVLARHLREDVSCVSLDDHALTLSPLKKLPVTFVKNIKGFLDEWTGSAWTITLSKAEGDVQTLQMQEKRREEEFTQSIKDQPLVDEALKVFEGAEIQKIVKK